MIGSTARKSRCLLAAAMLVSLTISGCSGCQRAPAPANTASHLPPENPATESSPPAEPLPQAKTTIKARTVTAESAAGTKGSESGSLATASDAAGTGDAEQASQRSEQLSGSARAKARAGDHRGAFRDASEAWEIANGFPSNARCKSLAQSIYAELDELADKANQEAQENGLATDVPLIEK